MKSQKNQNIEDGKGFAKANLDPDTVINPLAEDLAVALRKITEMEHRYHNLIHSSASMIAFFRGKDMIIEIANDAIIETWGKGKEVFGKSLFTVLPEIVEQGFIEILHNVYTTGITYHAYAVPVNLTKNGKLELFHYTFTYEAQRGINGEIEGIAIIANEVTPEVLLNQKLKESELFFRQLADYMPEKVTNATPNGTIFYYSKSWQDYTGASFDELINDGWAKWIHPDDVEETTKRWVHSLATSANFDMELRMLNQVGNYRWHSSRARAVKDENGNTKLWIGFNTDIHHQKRYSDELEDAVEEGSMALKKSNENLENKAIQLSEAQQMGQLGNWEWDVVTDKITWSDELYRIHGLIPQMVEMDYKSFTEFIHPDDKEYASGTIQEALIDHKPYNIFYRIVREDGTVRMLNGSGNIFTDSQGNTIKMSGSAQDVTEKRMASQYAYSRSLIEASLDPLVVISPNGKVTDMNEAMEHITGKTRNELKNTDFKDYFTDPEKAHQIYQQVFQMGFVADYPLTMKDHQLTDVLFNGSIYKDEQGHVLGAVVVARDISEQKKIEKEINEARIMAELATAIAEESQGKAEEAVKSKQQFLSNMSHEIRTPMNAIIGFTKVVLKTDLTAKQKEYLTAIKMSGDALILLINDILDLAKVDAGKMTFEQTPFKMEVSISTMLHLFETKIQEKNLVLIKEYDPTIPEVLVGDPARLNQIILNLVSNAVKFTTNGTITVSIKLLSKDDKNVHVEFAVKDTGIGIATEKIDQIFENFQQATTGTSRLYGGTGLGLAIVKQLVESQGGNIRVESTINEGSVFSFTLNFQITKEEPEFVANIMELDSQIKDLKILVVEDMALNQLLMRTLLDDFGFECDIAGNGKIAIDKLQTKNYDLVLMDLQMPEMNGFEATEYIRNIMKSDVPIIALTADVTTVDVAKCKAVGMNDYIAKPVDEQLLYGKIVALVKKNILAKAVETKTIEAQILNKIRHTDLGYLNKRTKSNPKLMMEMISIFLEQTPPLVLSMKQSFIDKDWQLLGSSVHKMIPSFSIMGMNADFEMMAKKIQDYATAQTEHEEIKDMVTKLEDVFMQSFEELKQELAVISEQLAVNS